MIGIGIDQDRIEVIERGEDIARVRYHGVEFEVRAWSETVIWGSHSGCIEEVRRLRQDASLDDMATEIAGQIAAGIAIHVGVGKGGAA